MPEQWMPDDQETLTSAEALYGLPTNDKTPQTKPTLLNNIPVSPTTLPRADMLRPPPPPTATHESAARERMRRRRVSTRRGGEWAWVVIAGALFSVVVVISLSVFVMLRATQAQEQIVPTAAVVLPTPVDARDLTINGTPVDGQQLTMADGRSIILTPWDGTSRFTVLVVGLDRRPGETGLAYRTDTMMLVSIDPTTQTLGLLSIPRDLYVEVPGYSELQRVNSPMVLGEIRQPGYGPELMKQTVQYNLGIRVHDYVAVDFNTFITIVDTIGGVDIDVPYAINDLQYPNMDYGYDPFYIRAGLQHLDGATALKYARTRHGDNDFARAERQQMVLYAIRDKVLSLDMLPQLIVQAPTLWNALQEGVSTGLTFDQIIQLVWYLKDVPAENIKTGVIDSSYTIGYSTPQGASVLVPDRARMGELMVEVFGTNYSE